MIFTVRQNWRSESKCIDDDPSIYEIDNLLGDVNEAAAKLCDGCPVIAECLADALSPSKMTDFIPEVEPTELFTSGVVRGGRAFTEDLGSWQPASEFDPRYKIAEELMDGGATTREIAERFKVSPRTVTRWVRFSRNPHLVKHRALLDACRNGHKYTAESTLITKNGYRSCAICESGRRQRSKDKAAAEPAWWEELSSGVS